MILLDANVLVYALNADVPQHGTSRKVVEAGRAGQLAVVLVPQVLLETYAVITDGRRVQRPLSPEHGIEQIHSYAQSFPVLPFTGEAIERLHDIVTTLRPLGQQVFDAALAAQMYAHGIQTLCTFNTEDFRDFTGLDAQPPAALLRRHRLR